jgi:hypothetical protein
MEEEGEIITNRSLKEADICIGMGGDYLNKEIYDTALATLQFKNCEMV